MKKLFLSTLLTVLLALLMIQTVCAAGNSAKKKTVWVIDRETVHWDDGSVQTTIMKYNKNGLLKTFKDENNTYTFKYNKKYQLTSQSYSFKTGGSSTTKFTYSGSKVKKRVIKFNTGLTTTTKYIWKSDKKMVEKITGVDSSGKDLPGQKASRSFVLNAMRRPVSLVVNDTNGKRTLKYNYNGKGYLTSEKWTEKTGEKRFTHTYTLNDKGLVQKITSVLNGAAIPYYMTYHYKKITIPQKAYVYVLRQQRKIIGDGGPMDLELIYD